MSAAVYSLYSQHHSIPGCRQLHRNIWINNTETTWTQLIRMIIHSLLRHHQHHHLLVFSVAVTELLKILIPHPDLKSITNASVTVYN